jgi:hypothetical protein
MSQIVGGLRTRLIHYNLKLLLENCLDDLGWFSDSAICINPVVVLTGDDIDQRERDKVAIEPNVVSIAPGDSTEYEWELGSPGLYESRWSIFIDVFAESEAVGLHLAGDVKDIIQGRFDSIGRSENILDVLDYTQATPTSAFVCQFDAVTLDRAQNWRKTYEKFWWMVTIDVLDYIGNENDT